MNEYDFEPVPGLPEELPEGERLLWQGAPRWQNLCRRTLHVNKIAAYFGIILLWRALEAWPRGPLAVLESLWLLLPAGLGIGLLLGLAWLMARTTLYTVTDRRIVMRFGVALPLTLNLPFNLIHGADLRLYRDGSGDIPLTLERQQRLSWLILWPHTRPWCLGRPRPMLRGLPQAEAVADLLARSLAGERVQPLGRPREATRSAPAAGRPAAV